MRLIPALLLVSFLIGNVTFAQINQQNRRDTLKISLPNFATSSGSHSSKGTLKNTYKMPLILVATGLFSITDNEILSRAGIYEERNERIPNFHHCADDYLQHAPILAVYGLNLVGVKGKNNFGNRTALLIKSELIMATMTISLKKITAVPRPDSGTPNSFPSGHTAQAFATATFLSKEYGHKSIWYSIAAYSMATTVGAMRVMNNRHWISDVLVGAGIGIFSTNLAYLTHQYKWGSNKKAGQTIVMPSFDGQIGMLSLVYQFN